MYFPDRHLPGAGQRLASDGLPWLARCCETRQDNAEHVFASPCAFLSGVVTWARDPSGGFSSGSARLAGTVEGAPPQANKGKPEMVMRHGVQNALLLMTDEVSWLGTNRVSLIFHSVRESCGPGFNSWPCLQRFQGAPWWKHPSLQNWAACEPPRWRCP
jgi:hypothetical protein